MKPFFSLSPARSGLYVSLPRSQSQAFSAPGAGTIRYISPPAWWASARQPVAQPEPGQRQEEDQPDGPTEDAVPVLPPEDALELRQAHAGVDLLVLGRLLVLVEDLQPVLLGAMLAIAVIMGLLTMCTPSAAAAAPDAAPASSVIAHSTHAVGGEHSVAPVTLDDGHNGHMTAMACVMALLAFMVVLALPRESRARLSQPAPANRAATLPWSVPRGRPSLLFLCISRT